jgi:hypothetical protein
LSTNEHALAIAKELGFVPRRRLERMRLGNDFNKNDDISYAIAGFELG